MNKPADIPQDVWETSAALAKFALSCPFTGSGAIERIGTKIARAIMTGSEYDPDAPPDHSADNAADFIFKHLSSVLGVDGKWSVSDGTETWDGDVAGTLYNILTAAGIWDDEAGALGPPTLDWRYVPSHVAEGPPEVRHADGWLVCETCSDSYARIMSAAPDLLEALKAARLHLTENPTGAIGWNATLNAAETAIIKAEGKL